MFSQYINQSLKEKRNLGKLIWSWQAWHQTYLLQLPKALKYCIQPKIFGSSNCYPLRWQVRAAYESSRKYSQPSQDVVNKCYYYMFIYMHCITSYKVKKKAVPELLEPSISIPTLMTTYNNVHKYTYNISIYQEFKHCHYLKIRKNWLLINLPSKCIRCQDAAKILVPGVVLRTVHGLPCSSTWLSSCSSLKIT